MIKKILSTAVAVFLASHVTTYAAAAADTNPVEACHYGLYKDTRLSFPEQHALCAEGIAELEERLGTLQKADQLLEIEMLKQLYYQTMKPEEIALKSFTKAMAALLAKERTRLGILQKLAAPSVPDQATPARDAAQDRRLRAQDLRTERSQQRRAEIAQAVADAEALSREVEENRISFKESKLGMKFVENVIVLNNYLTQLPIGGGACQFNAGFCPIHGVVVGDEAQHAIRKIKRWPTRISMKTILDDPVGWFSALPATETDNPIRRPQILLLMQTVRGLLSLLNLKDLPKAQRKQFLEALEYLLRFEWACKIEMPKS